ncbi:DNA-3-methyladenine glycosylase I [Pseudidiomarina planktonica]|uniref:DNA-3-methyladenine glycosylase I n=1 Tax=Pseudidiomarina planktonica TaxID=1323738 RepID=A0A1Y6E656_9GAMM|nr:DNA-3-methyladenine glycosylase I [Pseudidiomarina planktonica]RUO66410.1 DNA-3-methyladenine glycosylase I [Pseudidiomarina planktonica]SMQ58225.1 DNA-3-methyladenine glycosylase I [Pseudidiomarina planktonica]
MDTNSKRCSWCGTDADYVAYHDQVWGRPVADSRELFEKLCLDGQQAGLSWITILRKQKNYQEAFCGFEPEAILAMPAEQRDKLMFNAGIVRNKLKIESIFKNAEAYLRINEREASFAEYLWQFVGGKPIINAWRVGDDFPTRSAESDAMAKALKKEGFNFVGTTICYAFMQAVGMVNDHVVTCPCYEPVCAEMRAFNL